MGKDQEEEFFLRPDICGPCGGKCCKGMPGHASPKDFGLPKETSLRKAIASGKWAIDWWEGDPRSGIDGEDPGYMDQCYYVRPATVGKEGKTYDASWGGVCTFLTDTGCLLEPKDRPLGCTVLEPVAGEVECKIHGFTKQAAALSWFPYQDLLGSFR